MSVQKQLQKIGQLLQRKSGVTAAEIMRKVGTTCPHKRVSDMQRLLGWSIKKKETNRDGCKLVYSGRPPK